jgi:aminoglycoside phosphotransferase (APT) family kinase protein
MGGAMEKVDPESVLAALGVGGVERIERVTGGADTLVWKVTTGQERSALRLFREEQGEAFRRERIAMEAARAAGLPVPAVRRSGEWCGRPVLLLEWCEGRTLVEELLSRPDRTARLGREFGRMQAGIHSVRTPQGLGQADDWIRLAGEQAAGLQERMREVARPPGALLHLDYHPMNVLTDGARVTAVLDWANARAGDVRADLARTSTLLRLSPVPRGARTPELSRLRRELERAWRAGYADAAGWPRGMGPFYAWAGAMMLRDLASRAAAPEGWMGDEDLEPVRWWIAGWKRRCGL